MNLASLSDLVKPERWIFLVAVCSALLTLLFATMLLRGSADGQRRMDSYGTSVATALAALAADPMSQPNRLHLAVLGNRLVETPEIRGVASYGTGGRVLASTGDVTEPYFEAPVLAGDDPVGFVRVALWSDAFANRQDGRLWVLLGAALLGALSVVAGSALARAVRDGRLTLPRAQPVLEHQADATAQDAAGAEECEVLRHYLLAVNFYNQLTLPAGERTFELSLCSELAGLVADVYDAQVETLPGVGLLVDFEHTDDPDRPFQVICASLVLARLLADESVFGSYRLGLNVTDSPAHEAVPLDDDAVADAALLSALGKDLSLAVSAPFAAALQGTAGELDRLDLRPLVNPLLDELATSDTGCYRVFGLADGLSGLVDQQVVRLRAQRDATSNPSTF